MVSILPQPLPNSLSPRQEDVLSKAWAFLSLLDPDASKFHFQIYNDVENEQGISIYGGLYEKASELLAHNASKFAVAVGVNVAKENCTRAARNIERVRAIVADDDTPRKSPRKDFPLKPSIINQTSRGKYQYIWCCDDLPVSLYKKIQQGLAAKYHCDKTVFSPAMVIRLVGFYHNKRDPFQSYTKEASTIWYTAEQIILAFPPITDKPTSDYYVDEMPHIDRVQLKDDGKYPAEAIAWTIDTRKDRPVVTIRYRVDVDKNTHHYIHQYVRVHRKPRLNEISVTPFSKLHKDLIVLGVAKQYDLDHLPMNVFDEYLNRKLQVQVLTTTKGKNPKKNGKLVDIPKALYYSTIHAVWDAGAAK